MLDFAKYTYVLTVMNLQLRADDSALQVCNLPPITASRSILKTMALGGWSMSGFP